jgi:hypothetical protein
MVTGSSDRSSAATRAARRAVVRLEVVDLSEKSLNGGEGYALAVERVNVAVVGADGEEGSEVLGHGADVAHRRIVAGVVPGGDREFTNAL